MLVAQAVVAAARTVAERAPHVVHAHFLRPGRYGEPLSWSVERVRDGRQLAVRAVAGRQGDRVVLIASVGFARPGEGLAHQDAMPSVPGPDGLPDWEDVRARMLADPRARRPDGPLELRDCDPSVPGPERGARRRFWIRLRGVLPDDPVVHAAAVVFASDRGLLGTAARAHRVVWTPRHGASIDHAVWLHGPVRFDGWHLRTSESPVATGGRAFVLGTVWTADGRRLASIAQEGIVRTAGSPAA